MRRIAKVSVFNLSFLSCELPTQCAIALFSFKIVQNFIVLNQYKIMKMRHITNQHHFRYQRHSDDARKAFSRPALNVISANVEDLFNSKEQLLATICKYQNCDALCLQKTHCGTTNNCLRVHSLTVVVERPHLKYGSVTFVKTGTIIESTSMTGDGNCQSFGT